MFYLKDYVTRYNIDNHCKRFGPHGRDKCESYFRSCLEILGVEFPEEE